MALERIAHSKNYTWWHYWASQVSKTYKAKNQMTSAWKMSQEFVILLLELTWRGKKAPQSKVKSQMTSRGLLAYISFKNVENS